jgi:hypothetical protein
MMCLVMIFIIFRSSKYNFEYPDTNTVQMSTDMECLDSGMTLPFECRTLSVGWTDR